MVAAWERTPLGSAQRAFRRALLKFARPWQIPQTWLTGQYKVAQLSKFTETTRRCLRHAVSLTGQREVLSDQLPRLRRPTLVMWGIEDKVLPYWQGNVAVARLKKGALKLMSSCGHLPHVEQSKRFVSILGKFLSNTI